MSWYCKRGSIMNELTGRKRGVFLSVIIPARNEEGSVGETIAALSKTLKDRDIHHEIIVVDDGSTDGTREVILEAMKANTELIYTRNDSRNGFGLAIRKGLESYRGDAAVIFMADGSDDPRDIVRYYEKLEEGYDCVFGSRFMRGSKVSDYPLPKLLLNRAANTMLNIVFRLDNNDITNAFKCYRREVIEGISPVLSLHFNITVELPLKAAVRGYSYATVPISWTGRVKGIAKFKIKEMGSRYMFIILYILLEKLLSRGDYVRRPRVKKPG